jgi:AcrR family transcriptional regulator
MIQDTKQKILDTAERLFGEQGYDATSLRQIIAEAGVNLAAVHYHFGSKEELLDELVVRRAGPVNEARIAMLDLLEAAEGPPVVEKVLEAFLLPTAETANRNPQFVKLMGRILTEGLMPSILEKHFQVAAGRFLRALGKALPDLPRDELRWRVHFMVGAMAHTMCRAPEFPKMVGATGDFDEPGDFQTRMERLVTFLSAGFRAPVPQFEEKR